MKQSSHFRMMNLSGADLPGPDTWSPILVPGEAINDQIQRLADEPRPDNGRRAATIIHPQAKTPGLGFAPGIDVTINVLKPGERTRAVRRNSSQIEICLGGVGVVECGGRSFPVSRWDVWNIPSMQFYAHKNTGHELMVRLTYSNAPLLEKLGVHYFDPDPGAVIVDTDEPSELQKQAYNRSSSPDIAVGSDGARLRGYEFLTDIEVVENKALHWPWADVSQKLSSQPGDGKRTILLLYNPATGRRMGTTHSFFATMSSAPGGFTRPPRGHRHNSVAINYHFQGAGESEVDGHLFEWRAGDLLLSAPGWSEHAHGVAKMGSNALTVQDHPLHIGMESLIWQERMDGPILVLGAEAGVTGYVYPREQGQ